MRKLLLIIPKLAKKTSTLKKSTRFFYQLAIVITGQLCLTYKNNMLNEQRLQKYLGTKAQRPLDLIDSKIDNLLERITQKKILPEEVANKTSQVFGSTFSELGYRALHLEDEPVLQMIWKELFESSDIKLSQTSKKATVDFWLPHLDREKTFFFFDGDINREFVGAKLAIKALDLGFKNVVMATSRERDELRAEGLPDSVPNLLKPGIGAPTAIKIILDSDQSHQPQ